MLANAICERLSRRIQAVAGRRRAARHQRPVRPAEGIAGAAAQRRERARGLQGAEQFRRHPGHADQRPAALRQQPAARRGARADARCAGQIRPDRSQPPRLDRCRRHPRGAAVADHRQSARAICRCAQAPGRACRANWVRGIRRCARSRQQVEDLRRTINEEVERFAQSAKNDLTRARDYEASLNKALEAQKRQSVQMSQASVRPARARARGRGQPRRLSVVPQALARNRGAGKPEHLERAHHRRSHRAAAAHLPAGA